MADLELDGPNSAISVDTLKPKTATTLTLGESGDTIALGSGALQTGFGRTGTVDWDTTPKTTSFTAVSGNGYFVDTTSGAITVTLPAGSANAIVAISDYASNFQTNNVTITPDGTDNINGVAGDATLSTEGLAVTLVFVDSTRGWKSVTGSDNDTTGVLPVNYIVATGGTITTSGDFKIHTFTSSGTFTVTDAGGPTGSNTVDYLVVAGGGGSGAEVGGGGGAGGYRESFPNPATGGTPVSVQGYPITVGGGGAGWSGPTGGPGTQGGSSVFSTITSAGGGEGGGKVSRGGGAGGSGGGAGYFGAGGSGNTPSVSPPQGNNGGAAPNVSGGAGGGASSAGANGPGANGGNGTASSITGSSVTRAGGGGGSGSPADSTTAGAGGPGGGGAGSESGAGTAGTANTGGGGGGGLAPPAGAAGGSGIVVIRYKFQ